MVRVGGTDVTRATVEHWISVLAAGHPPDAATARYRGLVQRALDYTISNAWLAGAAGERGVTVSDQEVQRRLAENTQASFPGGEPEVHEFVKATGQTIADMAAKARSELTALKLRQGVEDGAPPITHSQIAGYYRRHLGGFTTPELREVRITNRKTAAAANQLKREVAAGKSFARLSQRLRYANVGTRSDQERTTAVTRALYAAQPNVLSGPVKGLVDYYVFELVRTIPGTRRPLARVEHEIGALLRAQARRRTLAAFVAAWRTKWTARTDCRPGYVVQKCRQYAGPMQPEGLLEAS
jgi:foldase protein PrsA